MKKRKEKKIIIFKRAFGFSLIEILVAITILAMLTIIAVPFYSRYLKNSQAAEAYTNLAKLGDTCLSKVVRNKYVGQGSVNLSMPSGKYFSYSGSCSASGSSTFTATGTTGQVSGKTLTLTVSIDATGNVSKTWGGSLLQ